jgi:hypothetical protein
MHFTNTNLYFCTSTIKWCVFFNLFIVDWVILPMFNYLLICQPTNTKKQRNISLSMINVCLQIYIQKSISIFWEIIFHEKHLVVAKCLLPDRNKKCWLFHTIHLITLLLHIFPSFSKRCRTSYLPSPIHFNWCSIVYANKSINDWTLDFACWVDIHNLCVTLFPCGKNQ